MSKTGICYKIFRYKNLTHGDLCQYEPIGMLYMHQEPHFNNPDYVECESCELEFLNKKLANS